VGAYYSLETLRGIVVAIGIFAMVVAPIFRHSPVKAIADVEATVEGFTLSTGRSGIGSRYTYILRLDNGNVIVASDYLSKPHIKGSRVKIERVTHENGRTSYRFPFFGGSATGSLLALLAP
jgi:hypothetical protein